MLPWNQKDNILTEFSPTTYIENLLKKLNFLLEYYIQNTVTLANQSTFWI